MNLMWFENFWIVGGVVLFFALGLPLFLFLVSTLSFTVPVLQVLVSTSPFSRLIDSFFAKGSNSGALAPISNWHFELCGWELWKNLLGFEFLSTGSNWHFESFGQEIMRKFHISCILKVFNTPKSASIVVWWITIDLKVCWNKLHCIYITQLPKQLTRLTMNLRHTYLYECKILNYPKRLEKYHIFIANY